MHDIINSQILQDKLAFVIIDGKMTDYIISSKGIIYRLNIEKGTINFIRPYMEKDGHLRVSIHIPGKTIHKYLHQLVAVAFVYNPDPDNKTEIHHIDGDELNNDYNNLVWVSRQEHAELTKQLNQYKGNRGSTNGLAVKYSDKQIEDTCRLLEDNMLYPNEICAITGISYSMLQHLLHRPESWDYIKEKYDISKYNKFRRSIYTQEQKESFLKIKKEHPEYTLRIISEMLDVKYEAVKNWNRTLNKK